MSDEILTDKARKDWNQLAENYQAFRQKELGNYNEIVEIPAMLSLIGDVEGKKVLDAGCGYGHYSLLLAKRGATVTGIDLSEKMVEFAKNNAAKASAQCQFFICDIQDLSMFNSDNFDIVTSSIVVGYLDNIRKAFSEVFRVLKPKGIFTFSENHPLLMKGQWIKDSQNKKLYWKADNYFDRSIEIAKWWTGETTSSRHRTVQDYFDTLISSGFVVDRLIEPEPIDKGKSLNVRKYESAKRIPYFILFKARKPT